METTACKYLCTYIPSLLHRNANERAQGTSPPLQSNSRVPAAMHHAVLFQEDIKMISPMFQVLVLLINQTRVSLKSYFSHERFCHSLSWRSWVSHVLELISSKLMQIGRAENVLA